jgi:hypothetical protein
VARNQFPVIDVPHLEEAEARLAEIEPHIRSVFDTIGSREIPKASQELVEVLRKIGGRGLRRVIYGTHFFRKLSNKEFTEAMQGAEAAGLIRVSPNPPVELFLVERKKDESA